jgi:hypothetical protein
MPLAPLPVMAGHSPSKDGRLSTPYVPAIPAVPLVLPAAKDAAAFERLSRPDSAANS